MTWLSRRGVALGLALLCAGVAGVGACTQILGNDFVIITEDGAGGAAVGGAGVGGTAGDGGMAAGGAHSGGAGGLGGAGPKNYDCDWGLSQHAELARLEDTTQFVSGTLLAARRDAQNARLLLSIGGGTGVPNAALISVGSGGAVQTMFPAEDVFQFERTSVQALGALYRRQQNGSVELRLRQFSDNSPNGSSGNDTLVASANAFPGLTGNFVEARFAIVSSSIGNPVLDILAWWPTGGSNYRMGYARYSGNAVTFAPVTSFTDSNDAQVTAMVHYNGTTYGWLGSDSALGTRLLQITQQTTFPQSPTLVGLVDTFFVTYGTSTEETRFLALRNTAPLQFLTGAISNDNLANFDPTAGLNVAGSWDDLSLIPVAFGTHRWHGRMLTLVGTPFSATLETDLRYWFIDSDGKERGYKVMPFTATLPANETREGPLAGTSIPVGTDFDTAGGALHVFWLEYHDSPLDSNFPVLYYDRLICSLN